MRNVLYLSAVLALALTFGCGNPQEKLKVAAAAETTGNYREAAQGFAALALESAPHFKMPEPQKGKLIKPELWRGEMEKYISWLTEPEPAAPKSAMLRDALAGVGRCAPLYEHDNTAHIAPPKPLDTLPAFTAQWNQAFHPPAEGAFDWDGLVKRAADKKFSILRMSAAKSYTYDVNIISRKTSRRVNFTLYAESSVLVPLAPAEYTVIVKSTVEFQQGQYWASEYSAFNLNVAGSSSLINVDMKTKVVKK